MHTNTKWIMNWADRMTTKYGQAPSGYDWCRELAYALDKAGKDHPSDEALVVASQWEHGGVPHELKVVQAQIYNITKQLNRMQKQHRKLTGRDYRPFI